MPVNHPHNNVFEKVMELPQAAEALINHFFPAEILSELDLSTLKQEHDSFITEELQPYFSDVVYSCERKGKKTYLNFLFEHKSKYELPDLQLMIYAIRGYQKQKTNWRAANKIAKKKKVKIKKHIPTPILPVLLYHGTEVWQKKAFVDLFDLPSEAFKKYIPSIDYVLIDLQQYADKQLEAIQMKILMAMLLLFKHKSDKAYVLRNFPKFFIFVEEYPDGELTRLYIKVFVFYIRQAFNLKKEDMQKVMPVLPTPVKEEFMSSYDRIYLEGKIEGKIEGEIKGEIKATLKMLTGLLITLPTASDDLLTAVTKLPKATITALKKAFKGRTKTAILKIGRPLFESISNKSGTQQKEVDAFLLDLWKQYKKATKKK